MSSDNSFIPTCFFLAAFCPAMSLLPNGNSYYYLGCFGLQYCETSLHCNEAARKVWGRAPAPHLSLHQAGSPEGLPQATRAARSSSASTQTKSFTTYCLWYLKKIPSLTLIGHLWTNHCDQEMLALTGLGLRIISVIWEQDHCASGWSWGQLGEDIESLNTNLSLVRKGENQWGEVLVFCVILGGLFVCLIYM